MLTKIAIALVAIAVALPAAAQTFDMKLATATVRDSTEAWHNEFKTRIEARTAGRIKAQVFPGGQLGDIQRVIEGLQLGTIEASNLPPSFLVGLNPAFQTAEAPAVFDGIDHAQRVFTDPVFRDKITRLAVEKGVLGISTFIVGPSAYATFKPFRTMDDLKGQKIGVRASKIESDLIAALGGTGIPVTFTEVLPALQNKVIDGYRGVLPILAGRQFQTVTKYATVVDDALIPVVVWSSVAFLDKLPADLRQAVLDTGRDMDAWGFEASKAYDQRVAKLWTDQGGEVITLSPENRAELLRRASAVSVQNLGNHQHQQTREMFALMRELAAKHK
jgi:TRAP-type C4-dicarboxylate transport system substrate-binding protein